MACHNRLRFDYNCKEAIEDLNMAISKAARGSELRRESNREQTTRFKIARKW